MRRIVTIIAAVLLVASVAGAADIQGKVKTWDPATKMITLEDGTRLVGRHRCEDDGRPGQGKLRHQGQLRREGRQEGHHANRGQKLDDAPRVPTTRRQTAPGRRVAVRYGAVGFGTYVPDVIRWVADPSRLA